MKTSARILALGTALLTSLSLCPAAPRPADDDKAVREAIEKLAATAGKGAEALRKDAAAAAPKIGAKDDIATEMNLMGKRRINNGKVAGGFGIGPKATGKPDDGIEARVINLAKTARSFDPKDADALVEAAHRIAAIAEVTLAKAPTKKDGNKDPKIWKESSEKMSQEALAFAEAVKTKEAKKINEAAKKLNASCTECHSVFKTE